MQRRVMLGVMVFALLGSFMTAYGQEEGKKGKGGPGGALQAALAKANLSAEQKEKIKAINEDAREAMKAAREAKDKEAGKKVMANHIEKIMGVLDDDQKEIVKKHLAEAREKGGDKGGDKKKKKPE